MKKLRMKWVLIVTLAIPGMALSSCYAVLLGELRDAAITAVGDFTQNTASDLLNSLVPGDGTTP